MPHRTLRHPHRVIIVAAAATIEPYYDHADLLVGELN